MNTERLLANKKPRLNSYQLACGYLQVKRVAKLHMSVTLWRESGCYHVRTAYDSHPTQVGFTHWVSDPHLKEAQAIFSAMVAQLRAR